jgi:hypothetical protein
MKKYQNKIYIKSHIRPNFCINLPGGNSDNGVIINGWDCHMGDNQKFEYRKETGEIKNLVTGKCLDGWNPENRNGTKVVQWECHGGIQQSWFLDDKQRIRHRQNPSKCLDFPSSERGTRLTTWDCHDGSNQKFDNVPV